MTAKYTGQKGFRGTTPGTIPGFNDTYNAYPWVHAIATTVDYALNPSTFIEATYGFSNRRLGQIVVGPALEPVRQRAGRASAAVSRTRTWFRKARTTGR